MGFKRIIIVEDEFIIAEDIRSSLKMLGCDVIGMFGNAKEAYKQILRLKPDLLLVDVILESATNGIELAAKVRTSMPIPIIYITAHSDIKTLEQAALTMPYGYILKPFEDKELVAALNIAYHKHNMELALRKSEEKYRLLLENIPELIKVSAKNGQIEFISNFIETLLGYPLQHINHLNAWLELVHPQDKSDVGDFYKSLDIQLNKTECEYRMKSQDGNWKKIKEKIYPFQTDSLGTLFYSIFSLDC